MNIKIGTKIIWHESLVNYAVVFIIAIATRILLTVQIKAIKEIPAIDQHIYAITLNRSGLFNY